MYTAVTDVYRRFCGMLYVRVLSMNSWHIPGRYDFSIPEAQRLSDLSGIESDLAAVVRICAHCEKLTKDLPPPTQDDGMAWLADNQARGDLMFAAVIRYGRTFASGVRAGIPSEWLATLPSDLQEGHVYFRTLRDKYIAHSVSQLEDNQVFVMLTPQFAEIQEPTHITVDRGNLITLSLPELRRLTSLAVALGKVVAVEVESETSKLLAIARGMPLDSIKSRTTASVSIPGKAQTFKVRKKF